MNKLFRCLASFVWILLSTFSVLVRFLVDRPLKEIENMAVLSELLLGLGVFFSPTIYTQRNASPAVLRDSGVVCILLLNALVFPVDWVGSLKRRLFHVFQFDTWNWSRRHNWKRCVTIVHIDWRVDLVSSHLKVSEISLFFLLGLLGQNVSIL